MIEIEQSAEALTPLNGARITRWRMDLGRTIDYLETRDDIWSDALAYLGWSFGAYRALPLLALEDRLRVAVLASGGLGEDAAPLANPVNYAPRISLPVLMLSGRYDYLFPVDTPAPSGPASSVAHLRKTIGGTCGAPAPDGRSATWTGAVRWRPCESVPDSEKATRIRIGSDRPL